MSGQRRGAISDQPTPQLPATIPQAEVAIDQRAPNVVPALAKVWYYIREVDVDNVRKNFEICNQIADGAALMTDTAVTRRMLGASWPRHFSAAGRTLWYPQA